MCKHRSKGLKGGIKYKSSAGKLCHLYAHQLANTKGDQKQVLRFYLSLCVRH